nr:MULTISPECIES: hypothetical protein [unclassified Ensifer]
MDTPPQCVALVVAEIVPVSSVHDLQNLFDRRFPVRAVGLYLGGIGNVAMVDVGDQGRGHSVRRKNVVGKTGSDRAPRHAIEFGRLRRLYQAHAAFGSDVLQAFGAVAPCPGKHDRDRTLALLRGDRGKQQVDGMPLPARLRRP